MLTIKNTEKEPEAFVELEGHFLETYLEYTEDSEHVSQIMQKLPEDEVAALLAELNDDQARVHFVLHEVRHTRRSERNFAIW